MQILCALAKKRAIRQDIDFVVKIFEENPEILFLSGGGVYQMPVKDVQRPKRGVELFLVDRKEGDGGPNFY